MLQSKTRKFFQERSLNSNHPHNPPNDYELILLVIILHVTFYDKSFKIIKKCYVGRHNLLQMRFGAFL